MRLIIILLFFISSSFALVEERYPFTDQKQQQQFAHLLDELRCLVCQNQNLTDSQAPLAEDLRQQVYLKVKQGETNQSIIHYLTERYGQFVLYRPQWNSQTYLLWTMPIVLLFIGCAIMLSLIYRAKKQ